MPNGYIGARRLSLRKRFAPVRFVLATAALVLLGMVLGGAMSFPLGLLAWLLIAAAAIFNPGSPARGAAEHIVPADVSTAESVIETFIAQLPDPIVVLERSGGVVAFNRHAAAFAPALRRAEPVSLALRVPEIVEAIRRAAADGEPQRVEFFERVPVDRWLAAYVSPLEFSDRSSATRRLLVMAFHDLTPLRRVEEMRADFVANASHELRTPLASLSGFIDTLQGPARDDAPARERFLAIMKGQADRMARLIDDLLSLSRVELNAHVRPSTRVELVGIVRQVVDALQMLGRDRDVSMNLEVSGEPLHVLGDRDELTRVFENIIENGLKYGGSGKRLDISVARAEIAGGAGEAIVRIRDYGPGIPAEHLPRLTERFYRIDIGQSRAEGGTGLGLALVKHVLNRHRGRLLIESQPGQGAAFTVRLPLAP